MDGTLSRWTSAAATSSAAAARTPPAAAGPAGRAWQSATVTGPDEPASWLPPWDGGAWLNPPPHVARDGDDLLVTAAHGSDLWRTTAYGFVHDSGHALLLPFPDGAAVEVCFLVDYTEQFDQAGLLVRADAQSWIKAGVEVSDGDLQVGAVVTREVSDWSLSPVPHWAGREVTVRASRRGDAVTVRARADGESWRLVRVARSRRAPACGWARTAARPPAAGWSCASTPPASVRPTTPCTRADDRVGRRADVSARRRGRAVQLVGRRSRRLLRRSTRASPPGGARRRPLLGQERRRRTP